MSKTVSYPFFGVKESLAGCQSSNVKIESVDFSRFRLKSRGRRGFVRAVVQRVTRASVSVDGRVAGKIGAGLLVLLGVGRTDHPESASSLSEKIANLRIFSDDAGKMNLSLLDIGGSALVVSQFTLYADTRGGRRPSFIQAAPSEEANRLYLEFVQSMRSLGVTVETGVFQAHMQVELVNDGPVTIVLDSEETI
jgi:D-tyrosyl-tRNA(Tyr) deacylase